MTTMLMSVEDDDNGADVTRAGRNGGGDHQPPPAVDGTRPETRVTRWTRVASEPTVLTVKGCFMQCLLHQTTMCTPDFVPDCSRQIVTTGMKQTPDE